MPAMTIDPRLRANIISAIKEADAILTSAGFPDRNTERVLEPDISDFQLIYHLGVLHVSLWNVGLEANFLSQICNKHKLPFTKEVEAVLYPVEETTQ